MTQKFIVCMHSGEHNILLQKEELLRKQVEKYLHTKDML